MSEPGTAVERRDYDHAGRINMAMLAMDLPFGDYDFYLCRPAAFMQATYDGLRQLNVADDRIHAEAFGPASITAEAASASHPTHEAVATGPVTVAFARSKREAVWTPTSGSLLELAEANGLQPDYSCRIGSCGSCRTRLLSGRVAYSTEPTALVEGNDALICSCVPSEGLGGEGKLILDL